MDEDEFLDSGTWIIEDWMGKRIFPDKTFGSFQDARDHITEYANANEKAEADRLGITLEQAFNGICEDLYAIRLIDNDSTFGD